MTASRRCDAWGPAGPFGAVLPLNDTPAFIADEPAWTRVWPPGLVIWAKSRVLTTRLRKDARSPRRAAWYPEPAATFADAMARLRQHLWFERIVTSAADTDVTELISPTIQRLIETACYAP